MGITWLTPSRFNTAVVFLGIAALIGIACWEPDFAKPPAVAVSFNGHDMRIQGASMSSPVNEMGQYYYVVHVRAGAQTGGDGSFERPYSDIASAVTSVQPSPVLAYVWGGEYEVDGKNAAVHGNILLSAACKPLPLSETTVIPAQDKTEAVVRIKKEPEDPEEGRLAALRVTPGAYLALNGFRLAGDGTGVGVFLEPGEGSRNPTQLTLAENVIIEGFNYGIYSEASEKSAINLLYSNTLQNNTISGIYAEHGQVRLTRDNRVQANGLERSGTGIELGRASLELIRDNRIENNFIGIQSDKGKVSLGQHNRVNNNAAEGILAGNGDVLLAANNEISRNGACGIKATGDIRIDNGNTIKKNRHCGISGGNGTVTIGMSNSIEENGRSGIYNRGQIRIRGNFNFIRKNNQLGESGWYDINSPERNIIFSGSNNDIPIFTNIPVQEQ